MEGRAQVSVQRQRDLRYSEEETQLRSSVRSLLRDSSPWETVLSRVESEEVTDTALWRSLSELGVAGLAVPESAGGLGASPREAAVVAEELGRSVAPVPFLGSAVLATSALLPLGDGVSPEATATLAELAAGDRTAGLAVSLATAPDAAFPEAARAAGGTVTGRISGVVDALTADVLVVPAVGADGPELRLVAAGDTDRVRQTSLDLTRPVATVELFSAPARRIASGDTAERALRDALTTGAALLASEQLGVAEWALDTTVEYAKTRTQFGRPIGSFQAVKHRLAELWVSISQARAVARNAASAVALGDEEAALEAAIAQAFVSEVAVLATEEAIQLHGGIGFTWEHPAHLYLKRAKSDAIALGTADRHRSTIARMAKLPGAAG